MSANKFAKTVVKLQHLHPWDVPVDTEVQAHIVVLYNQVHGSGGEAFAERESRYLNRAIVDDKQKWQASPLSVFLAYVDLAVKDLTLEPGAQALCYLLSRNIKLKDADNNDVWEKRVYISITGYGEILMRQRAGQIRHCDTPTVVYDGDEFSYREANGRKEVSYALNIDHNPARPIACFMKITRLDGSTDYAIILPEGWARLQAYSDRQNGSNKNKLYTSGVGGSIDPGFLIAKCVKHAFKSYPKLPIGKGMVMEADLPEEEVMPDYYSLPSADAETVAEASDAADGVPMQAKEKESFAEPADHSSGVTVDPAEPYNEAQDDGTF